MSRKTPNRNTSNAYHVGFGHCLPAWLPAIRWYYCVWIHQHLCRHRPSTLQQHLNWQQPMQVTHVTHLLAPGSTLTATWHPKSTLEDTPHSTLHITLPWQVQCKEEEQKQQDQQGMSTLTWAATARKRSCTCCFLFSTAAATTRRSQYNYMKHHEAQRHGMQTQDSLLSSLLYEGHLCWKYRVAEPTQAMPRPRSSHEDVSSQS